MNQKEKLLIQKQCIENRLTIYDVKYRVVNAPYFFTRKTMSFFKQTLKDFHVNKTATDGIFYVWCYSGAFDFGSGYKKRNKTERYFNAFDNKFYSHYLDAVNQDEMFTINNGGE